MKPKAKMSDDGSSSSNGTKTKKVSGPFYQIVFLLQVSVSQINSYAHM